MYRQRMRIIAAINQQWPLPRLLKAPRPPPPSQPSLAARPVVTQASVTQAAIARAAVARPAAAAPTVVIQSEQFACAVGQICARLQKLPLASKSSSSTPLIQYHRCLMKLRSLWRLLVRLRPATRIKTPRCEAEQG